MEGRCRTLEGELCVIWRGEPYGQPTHCVHDGLDPCVPELLFSFCISQEVENSSPFICSRILSHGSSSMLPNHLASASSPHKPSSPGHIPFPFAHSLPLQQLLLEQHMESGLIVASNHHQKTGCPSHCTIHTFLGVSPIDHSGTSE